LAVRWRVRAAIQVCVQPAASVRRASRGCRRAGAPDRFV